MSSWNVELLLVDDDPSITDLGKTVLERESDRFDVRTVQDGRAALEQIRDAEQQTDGVISDYEMPGMDGIELLKNVRIEDDNLPFFIYTGKGSEEIAADCVKYNADNYMQKTSPLDNWAMMADMMLRLVDQNRVTKIQEAMLTFSNDIITIIDTAGEIVYSSPAVEDVLGYDVQEIIGESAFNDIHPDDVDEIREKFEELGASTEQNRIRANFRYRKSDGDYVTLEAVASYQPEKFDGLIVNSRLAEE